MLGLRLQLLFFKQFGVVGVGFGQLGLQICLGLLGGLFGLGLGIAGLAGVLGGAAVVAHKQGMAQGGVAAGLQRQQLKTGQCIGHVFQACPHAAKRGRIVCCAQQHTRHHHIHLGQLRLGAAQQGGGGQAVQQQPLRAYGLLCTQLQQGCQIHGGLGVGGHGMHVRPECTQFFRGQQSAFTGQAGRKKIDIPRAGCNNGVHQGGLRQVPQRLLPLQGGKLLGVGFYQGGGDLAVRCQPLHPDATAVARTH